MKFTFVLAMPFVAAVAMAQTVTVSGKSVVFDAPPKMVNGTLMVPIRNLFDATGTDMRWKMERDVIEGLRKGTKIEISVGSRAARVNGKERDMDEAPYVWHGRTYAPLKFLAENLRYMISMDKGSYVLQEMK